MYIKLLMRSLAKNSMQELKTKKIFILLTVSLLKQKFRINKIKKVLKYFNTAKNIFFKTPLKKKTNSGQKQINYIISIRLTYSNIIMNLTTNEGLPKITMSSGINYFTGRLKTSRYAATTITEIFLVKCNEYFKNKNSLLKNKNILTAVHLTGIKKNRKTILRLIKKQFNIKIFKSNTTQPHNGCRNKKKRRK